MWRKVRLGDIAELYQPKTITKSEMTEDGLYPVYGANGIIGRYHDFNHDDEQLVIGCRGSCGEVNVTNGKCWITGNAMVIKPNNDVLLAYLKYYLLQREVTNSIITGTAQPQITRKSLAPVELFVPPLGEQQRIVAKLDAAFSEIDRAIEVAESKHTEVEKLKAALLSSLLRGEDWETVKLGEICSLRNGKAYKKSELLSEGKYPVLRVGNFFTNNHWYYSDLELDETKYCDTGDLLYAWSASFGPRLWESGKVIYHYHIWRVDVDTETVDKKFLFYWFEYDKELIKAASGTGTTMVHVSKGSMEKRSLHLPPLAEQQRIVAKLDAAFAEIDRANSSVLETKVHYQALKSAILAQELQPPQSAAA